MSKRLNEGVRVTPLYGAFSTAAGTSLHGKTRLDGAQDFAVLIQCKAGTVATGVTATAANYWDFTVTESTAATASGSAITGATLTLGAATAAVVRGASIGMLKVTSDCASSVEVVINGITYRTTAAGATASNGSKKLASAINGHATSPKLLHYRAVAEQDNTGIVIIEPDDDKGTGLTYYTSAAAATIAPYMIHLQGMIEIGAHKLSTNYPKYIGITASTFNASTSIVTASLLTYPTASPSFPGKVVTVAT